MRKHLVMLGFAFGFSLGFVLALLVLTGLQMDMSISSSEYRQCQRSAYTLEWADIRSVATIFMSC